MVSLLLLARVNGIPGPKGSLNAFCPTCARRGLPQKVQIREQSDVGTTFRKAVKLTVAGKLLDPLAGPYTGDVETRLTFYIHRQKRIKAGVEQDEWVPSHAGPLPTFRNSGDVEKHIRTVHDALVDAGLIENDCQVWRTVSEKWWADVFNPPGCIVEVRKRSVAEGMGS